MTGSEADSLSFLDLACALTELRSPEVCPTHSKEKDPKESSLEAPTLYRGGCILNSQNLPLTSLPVCSDVILHPGHSGHRPHVQGTCMRTTMQTWL